MSDGKRRSGPAATRSPPVVAKTSQEISEPPGSALTELSMLTTFIDANALRPAVVSGSTIVKPMAINPGKETRGTNGLIPPISTRPLARPLLEGHYCISLDKPLDAVPLISYLALRSMRTLCFLPTDDPWETYRVLFNRITGIKTLYCDGSDMNGTMSAIPLQTSAMMLRPANDSWGSGFDESLADCVIYWGVPKKLDKFKKKCGLRSRHSYVIISHPHDTNQSMQRFSGNCLWPHPATSLFNDQTQNSVLHELRLKMGHARVTMADPSVSLDVSKDYPSCLYMPTPETTVPSNSVPPAGHVSDRSKTTSEIHWGKSDQSPGHTQTVIIPTSSDCDNDEPTKEYNNKHTPELATSFTGAVLPTLPSSNADSNDLGSGFEAEKAELRTRTRTTGGTQPQESSANLNREAKPCNLRKIVRARRMLAPGLNYIELEPDMDEIAVSAYFALMSNKTMCIIRKQRGLQLCDYEKMFNALGKFSVVYLEDMSQPKLIRRAFRSFKIASSPAVLLLVHDASHSISFKSADPDCIIHWGLPLGVSSYASQISSFQRPVRSCLILPQEQNVSILEIQRQRLLKCGVAQYPQAVLQDHFGPASTYQMVCKVISLALAVKNTPSQDGRAGGSNSVVVVPNSIQASPAESQATPKMVSGHYYVVLGLARELEVIPLMAHVALRSKKTICCLPSDRLAICQRRIEGDTKLRAVICGSKAKAIKKSIDRFKSQSYHILLRAADMRWTSLLGKSPIESLVYWGVPPNIEEYFKECSQRVSHSCLIVTEEQYRQILSRNSSAKFPLEQHPSLQQLYDDRERYIRRGLDTRTPPSRF